MAEITVFIDDSAEQKRRRRQRWIEFAIVLLFLPILSLFSERSSTRQLTVGTQTSKTVDHIEKIIVERQGPPSPMFVPVPGPTPVPGPHTSPPQPPPPLSFAVSPSALHFGARDLPAQLVTITNASNVSLQSTSNDFLVTNNCTGGAPCTAAVVFSPAKEGSREGELRVTSGSETKTVRLSGVTVVTQPPPPHLPRCATNLQPAIDPPNIHFTGKGRRTIVLSNPHACPLRIDAIDLINTVRPSRAARGYKLEGDAACRKVLQPGERCSFDIATTWWFTLHANVHVKSSVVIP
jgi:hypothetical protein